MRTSPYEGDGDIEQEGTEEVDGIQSSGDEQDDREGGNGGIRPLLRQSASCAIPVSGRFTGLFSVATLLIKPSPP